jgi:hypothetical protein
MGLLRTPFVGSFDSANAPLRMTEGGFVEILLRMTEEVIMEKEYLLFRAGSGLGVQREFKEACADFL